METVKIELMNDSSEVVRYDREGVRLGIREGNLSAHPGLRAPCHWHDDLEWIHILDGMMGYSINGREIILHTGDSLLVNARHRTVSRSQFQQRIGFRQPCAGFDREICDCFLYHLSLWFWIDAYSAKLDKKHETNSFFSR